MRIRILKLSLGIMDGVSLSHLQPGLTYEVPVSLGTWLVSQRFAEEDATPFAEVIHLDSLVGGIIVTRPRVLGPDRFTGNRRVRKKR